MAEYINRDTLVGDFIEKQFKNNSNKIEISEAIRMVNSQPQADVVEVVRCKDCKHWENRREVVGNIVCTAVCMKIHTESYCSYGERKNDNA